MNIYLPDSVPNPSLVTSYLDGDGAATYGAKESSVRGTKVTNAAFKGNGNSGGNGNGVCGLRNANIKLRVPIERR